MADISFYKYLEAAFRFKLFNPQGQRTSFSEHFKSLNYNLTYQQIFYYARRLLPPIYTNEANFPNNEEGNLQMAEAFLKNLDRHQDPQLDKFFNQATAPPENETIIEEAISQSAEASAEQQPAAEGAPAGGAPAGQPPPSAPSRGPSMPQIPQIPQMPQMPALPSVKDVEKETGEAIKKEEEVAKAPRAPTGRGIRIPQGVRSAARGVGSQVSVAFKKGSSRAMVGARKGLGAAIGRGGRAALGGLDFGIKAGISLSNEVSRLRVGTIGKKWIIGLLLLLIIGAILIGVIQTQTPPVPPPPTGTGDISQCIFYRGGDSIQGITFNNQALPTLITDVSNKVGVPPAIVAGIMRVETSSAFLDPPTSDYVANDYDAHFSVDPSTGQPVAYGIMQFTPNTFLGVFSRDQSELQTLFGKTEVTTNIDPQDAMAPANVFRIYSIKDSITAAAFKARDDKRVINGDGPWDQTTVYEIARRYYGALEYTGWDLSTQNYGADLWKSYSNCTAAGPILANASCPIEGGVISCASYGPVENRSGFTEACAADTHGNGGHCNDNYIAAFGLCIPREQIIDGQSVLIWTAKSIDVVGPGTTVGSSIYLPNINGINMNWFYKGAIPADNCSGCSWGYIRSFQSEPTPQGIWIVDFTHVNASDPFSDFDHQVVSGQVGATHANITGGGIHVHVTLGLQLTSNFAQFDPNWKFADRDLRMCI